MHGNTLMKRGFTLIELLVSMTVLSLILVLLVGVINGTTNATQSASQRLDVDALARDSLDRIGTSISGLVSTGGITALVVKNINDSSSGVKNDGLIMVTKGRVQQRQKQLPNNADIRMAIVGCRVRPLTDDQIGNALVPMLSWGDGTITWPTNNKPNVRSDFVSAISSAVSDINNNPSTPEMLEMQRLSGGIFRFEVTFLLDDGTVADVPPLANTPDNNPINPSLPTLPAGNPNAYWIPFTAAQAAPAVAATPSTPARSSHYVRALIVGIAALPTESRQLIVASGNSVAKLGEALPDLPNPNSNNQTPLQVWDFISNATLRGDISPPAYQASALKTLRTYQRYFYVR